MSTESLVISALILGIGIPVAYALFAIARSMRDSRDSQSKSEAVLREATQALVRSAEDAASRQEAILKELATAILQASQKSSLASESVSESLRVIEKRVTEAVGMSDSQSKEDRLSAQAIAGDNRQALRQATETLRDRIEELKEKVAGISSTMKSEINEYRKWHAEKSNERMEREVEQYSARIAELAEQLNSSGKAISDKLDQGARLVHKTMEVKGDEISAQVKSIASLAPEIRGIASQLEGNRVAIEALRKAIVADVSTLTGD